MSWPQNALVPCDRARPCIHSRLLSGDQGKRSGHRSAARPLNVRQPPSASRGSGQRLWASAADIAQAAPRSGLCAARVAGPQQRRPTAGGVNRARLERLRHLNTTRVPMCKDTFDRAYDGLGS